MKQWYASIIIMAFILAIIVPVQAAPQEMDLRVTEPNNLSEWVSGTPNLIRWNLKGELGPDVTIKLSRIGWVNAQMTITENAPIGQKRSGSYSWKIPENLPPGDNYSIFVSSNGNSGYYDTTSNFKIIAGKGPKTSITLDASPKGGEKWTAGTSVPIRWSFSGKPGDMVRIVLLQKGQDAKTELFPSASLGIEGKGVVQWKIPKDLKPATDYQIGIVSTSNPFCQDVKDLITIVAAP